MNKYLAALVLVSIPFSPYAMAAAPVPVFSSCVKPVWPKEALRNGYQGTVTMSFLITKEGTVQHSRIVKSSGYPSLDVAAQEGIRTCKFKPGTVDGEPAEAWQQMQYVWTLDTPNRAQPAPARAGAEPGEAAAQDNR
jgi:TonB family protein